MTVPSYHVLLRAGPADAFAPAVPDGDLLVGLRMDGGPGPDAWSIDESVWHVLGEYDLTPSQAATDFFRFATAAYCADLLVPHRTAFDRWSRDIILHVPVDNLANWEQAGDALRELLGFLTGDHWTLAFRAQMAPPPGSSARNRGRLKRVHASHASLLSGGLDSAIGAVDLLAADRTVAFVSHNSKSGGAVFSSPSQRDVLTALGRHFDAARFNHYRFRLNPPRPIEGTTEGVTTTRSRSIIFFALGLLVTSGLDRAQGGNSTPLVVPENGLISLNVPLTKARLGSWSTRTTHPHTLAMLRGALAILGIPTSLQTPYATQTKGEMILSCANRTAATDVALASVSCAHPNQSRFLPAERRQPHCGTCVPCIIRRASMQHAGIDDGRYSFDLPRELSALRPDRADDAQAFLLALRNRRRPTRALDINRSGPLHVDTDQQLQNLLRVYDAGMDEVASHLGVPIE